MTNSKPRSAVGIVCLIVFLDIVGFSILFPLFPAMLNHYLEVEGEASWIGRLAVQLSEWAGGNQAQTVTLFGGVLGSIYSILQFLFAPVWGGLSDRVGRRPTLLITLAGTLAGYVLWIFAGSFFWLIGSRLLSGLMAGNISTATAVIADTTESSNRARGMGLVGMCIGLGFLFGPAMGGAAWSLLPLESETGWQAGLTLHPFSSAAAIAAALATVNLLWVVFAFKETLAPEKRGTSDHARVWNPFAQLSRLHFPGLPRTNLVYFLFLLAFSAMEFTLTFLAADRLGFSPAQITWVFVYSGLIIALVQGGVVRRLAPRLGEKKLSLTGLALVIPGFLLIAIAGSSGLLYAGLTFMALGSALIMPCLSALASRYAPEDRQGLALGTFRSMGALSRAIGPILGGLAYYALGSAAPYWAGALFLLIPLGLARSLPPVPQATP